MSDTNHKRQMHLATFLYSGKTSQAWRHPDIIDHGALNLDYFVEYAKVAEEGFLDALFLADSASVPVAPKHVLETLWSASQLEPVSLMAAVAARSSHVGLIYTASVSDTDPYLLARQCASLDHISNGRIGWNLVTTSGPGAHHLKSPVKEGHDERYDRALEFFDLTCKLWDTFEDNAFVVDKKSGVYFDTSKVHAPTYRGKYYQGDEPLRIARPPQGRPVIAQAGSSPVGREFGAKIADLIFCSNLTVEGARSYYADVKSLALKNGRNPEDVRIMTGMGMIWGKDRGEAERKFDAISSLHPVDVAIQNLGIDFKGHDLDAPFPMELKDPASGKMVPIAQLATKSSGRAGVVSTYAHRQGWSIRQTAQRLAATLTHGIMMGTASDIVDQMQEWHETRAADGFVIQSPYLLDGFKEIVAKVIPELQRRGLYRSEYPGTTLRENLGLDRPANQYTIARAGETHAA